MLVYITAEEDYIILKNHKEYFDRLQLYQNIRYGDYIQCRNRWDNYQINYLLFLDLMYNI